MCVGEEDPRKVIGGRQQKQTAVLGLLSLTHGAISEPSSHLQAPCPGIPLWASELLPGEWAGKGREQFWGSHASFPDSGPTS
jgi:hypothetical protein